MAKEGITKKRKSIRPVFLAVNVLVIIGLVAFGGFYFKKYRDLKNNPVSADKAAQSEIDRTVSAVGKLYNLPKDEKPQVATVKDKDKLKDQAFFDKAENNDITLIYSTAKLAILYRPSTNKIVNVSSVSIQNTPVVRVIGVEVDRLAVKKTLTESFKTDVSVKDDTNAKASYTGVTVIDLTGKNTEVAKKLAAGLKGTVATLPAGEDKPTGIDILIIAGAATPITQP